MHYIKQYKLRILIRQDHLLLEKAKAMKPNQINEHFEILNEDLEHTKNFDLASYMSYDELYKSNDNNLKVLCLLKASILFLLIKNQEQIYKSLFENLNFDEEKNMVKKFIELILAQIEKNDKKNKNAYLEDKINQYEDQLKNLNQNYQLTQEMAQKKDEMLKMVQQKNNEMEEQLGRMTEYINSELETNKQKNEELAQQKIEEYKENNQKLEKKVKNMKKLEQEFITQIENLKGALQEQRELLKEKDIQIDNLKQTHVKKEDYIYLEKQFKDLDIHYNKINNDFLSEKSLCQTFQKKYDQLKQESDQKIQELINENDLIQQKVDMLQMQINQRNQKINIEEEICDIQKIDSMDINELGSFEIEEEEENFETEFLQNRKCSTMMVDQLEQLQKKYLQDKQQFLKQTNDLNDEVLKLKETIIKLNSKLQEQSEKDQLKQSQVSVQSQRSILQKQNSLNFFKENYMEKLIDLEKEKKHLERQNKYMNSQIKNEIKFYKEQMDIIYNVAIQQILI